MNNLRTYLPPETETVLLQGRETILDLSNYGLTGQAGAGFGDSNIIEDPNFF